MAQRTWETEKVCFCEKVHDQVSLDVEVVYPAEWLPDQQPRVIAHRCSHGVYCNLDERAACVWAGTNPLVDPFKGK